MLMFPLSDEDVAVIQESLTARAKGLRDIARRLFEAHQIEAYAQHTLTALACERVAEFVAKSAATQNAAPTPRIVDRAEVKA